MKNIVLWNDLNLFYKEEVLNEQFIIEEIEKLPNSNCEVS